MNSGACFRAFLAPVVLGLSMGFAGCDDGEDGDSDVSAEDTTPSDDSADSGAEGPDIAFQSDFATWQGGGETFFLAKPEGDTTYADNNTVAVVGDHPAALTVHAPATDNGGYGVSVEVQWSLNELPVDLSAGNYNIQFDVYVPAAAFDRTPQVQWAFFTADFTPIYSVWYGEGEGIAADTWVTISADITAENVSYSAFTPPEDVSQWIFDFVRVQVILEDGAEGDELLYYVDNVSVTKDAPI